MSFQYPGSGPANVAEYMISALPWVTASSVGATTPLRIDFPYVTSFLEVRNPGGSASVKVGFTSTGVSGSNYVTVPPSGSFKADLRVKTLYLMSSTGTQDFELVAGLTLIKPQLFATLITSSRPSATASMEPVFGYTGI